MYLHYRGRGNIIKLGRGVCEQVVYLSVETVDNGSSSSQSGGFLFSMKTLQRVYLWSLCGPAEAC